MPSLKKIFKEQKGSTLVAVVALTAVLSISVGAYAMLSRGAVSNEVEGYNNMRALLIAEHGMLLAMHWLSAETNYLSVAAEFRGKHRK